MRSIPQFLVGRLEPRAGWAVALLVFGAAWCPALAASMASLRLPVGPIFWAGMAGAAMGLRVAGLRGRGWGWLYALAATALGVALLVAACGGLPPAALLWRDAWALAAAAAERLSGARPAPPELLTPRFLELSLPRAWRTLAGAPGAGEAGASLIVAALAIPTTLAGAAALGYAAAAGRRMIGWALPLTFALGLITILGGGGGAGLVVGMGVMLGLAGLVSHAGRERAWEAAGVGYSEELRWDVLGWGGLLGAGALMVALAIPTSLPRLPAPAAVPEGGLPSGLAAIERHVERGDGPRPVDPGVSLLPAVGLGVSLSDAPPETVAFHARLGAPLAPAPYPRYWRARVLNLYSGRAWSADARVGPVVRPGPQLPAPEGALAQEIELVGRDAPVLVALPDLLALDVPAREERLPGGALAAVDAASPARRYRAVSLPQELAPALAAEPAAPPPGQESLGLPRGLPPRVGELARSVTAGAAGQLEQALAVEAYLRQLPYAYEVRPVPAGGDAVDQFLFEMRHGYCTYYASAMAVMARTLGIPARLAVGYATGSYDAALGAYVVREADAHAWPELLIGGRWLPFEPTPVRPLPTRSAAAAPDTPLPEVPPEAPQPAPWAGLRRAAIWAGALAAAALVVGGAWLLWRRSRISPLTRAQLRLERFGAKAGVPWPAGATLHEYGRLLAERRPDSPALDELITLIETARYAGQPLTEAQRRRMREVLKEL
jgi:transglutaminase-like putative cysteine protease